MTRPCEHEYPSTGTFEDLICVRCGHRKSPHATDAHQEKVPAHNAPQPKDGRDTGTRVMLDRDEVVERVTAALNAVQAIKSLSGMNADYRDGYCEALRDTLDLLTGNIGIPLKRSTRE